ncbi:MAG: efflux RND transporter permease subunit [Patescibacteria group bacterium]|nr:efflux RND transporter permease subunit [Patescibacteria group bacterium]
MAVKKAKIIKVKKSNKSDNEKLKLLPRFSLFFFDRPRFTAILFLFIFLFGVASYTTLLKREGFPSISFPVASIIGTYIGDARTVDQKVALPISKAALEQEGASTVQSQAFDNFFNVFVQYQESVNAQEAAKELEQKLKQDKIIPPQAQVKVSAPYFSPAGVQLDPVDIGISVYAKNNQDISKLIADANNVVDQLNKKQLSTVENFFLVNPFEKAVNPFTGQSQVVQQSFDRYGSREADQNQFYNSVLVGVTKADGADILEFDQQVRTALDSVSSQDEFTGTSMVVSASFATDIKDNISELQRELLIALVAVLIIGSLIIAIRASLITVLSLIMIIFSVIGLLYLIGYTLNVITLFALILSLALIVDDTIIMVEAIDAQRRKQKDARKIVAESTRKISRAMLSATFVAILSFAPLLFVSGILGSFIRAIPVTVIAALIISLIVSLTFIPFLARFIMLRKGSVGKEGAEDFAAGFEEKIANFITKPMMWAKGSPKKLSLVGITALFVGFMFIAIGGYYGTKVSFNIFPSSKDTNNMQVTLTFNPGTNLEESQVITDTANDIIANSLGEYLNFGSLYNSGNERSATLSITLVPYKDRGPKSPELVAQVQKDLDEQLKGAQAKAVQLDAGPPAQAFTVIVVDDNRRGSFRLANDVAKFMETLTVTRPDGTVAKVTNVTQPNPDQFVRVDSVERVPVSAEFDGSDTSRLFILAEEAVNQAFPPSKVESYGLEQDALQFDLGQEAENQESFAALQIAFPLVLLAIYILLAVQFRSLLQPLLIFMAIPFSLFGISLSLYLTSNPFSFFAMLGFFALIGLSIKNTILLTDYANQARKAGKGAVNAISDSLKERFRPLISTSLTGAVAITPLAIISPFWQGLAVLIIFGLLSSTFLVLTVFPYYYLGAELLKNNINRTKGVILTISLIIATLALNLTYTKLFDSSILVLVATLITFITLFVLIVIYAYKRYGQKLVN